MCRPVLDGSPERPRAKRCAQQQTNYHRRDGQSTRTYGPSILSRFAGPRLWGSRATQLDIQSAGKCRRAAPFPPRSWTWFVGTTSREVSVAFRAGSVGRLRRARRHRDRRHTTSAFGSEHMAVGARVPAARSRIRSLLAPRSATVRGRRDRGLSDSLAHRGGWDCAPSGGGRCGQREDPRAGLSGPRFAQPPPSPARGCMANHCVGTGAGASGGGYSAHRPAPAKGRCRLDRIGTDFATGSRRRPASRGAFAGRLCRSCGLE